MSIEFDSQNVEITPALKTKAEEKITHAKKHFNNVTTAHVFLKVENSHEHIAEFKLHVPGKELFAQASSDDMYKSIDLAGKKLMSQIDKFKEKENSHR